MLLSTLGAMRRRAQWSATLARVSCCRECGVAHPNRRSPTGVARQRRSATAELAVGVVVLAITAVLVATPTPMDEAPAPAASSTSPGAGS